MKAKSRFLGIDDAPFRFSDETVPVVGVVVQAPSYIEGILTTLAEVDGHDATERIASMVRRSRYRAGLAAILIGDCGRRLQRHRYRRGPCGGGSTRRNGHAKETESRFNRDSVATPLRRLAGAARDHPPARDRGDPDRPWIGLGDLRRCEPNRGPRGALAHDRPRGPAGTTARRPSHRGGDRPRRIAGTRLTRCDRGPLT